MREQGNIYKEQFIHLNEDNYPYFSSIIDEMEYVKITIDLEIMKCELAERIFKESKLRFDLNKKILYINGHEITDNGYIKAENYYGNNHILYSEILRLQEIYSDYKRIHPMNSDEGKFITIQPVIFVG